MITINDIPSRSDGLCIRQIEDETFIITEYGDEIHGLDDVGGFIWRSIDGKSSTSNILELICSEYEVDKEKAAADLIFFLNTLLEKKLIVIEKK
jgi:hypothetical protein